MSEQTQEKVMKWISDAAQNIGEWVTKEVPPFIQEFLTWKFYESMFSILVYLFWASAATCFIFKYIKPWFTKLYKIDKENFWVEDERYKGYRHRTKTTYWSMIPGSIFCIIFLIFSLNIPYQEIKTCIQIKLAPKVYLIEYGSSLIKNNK